MPDTVTTPETPVKKPIAQPGAGAGGGNQTDPGDQGDEGGGNPKPGAAGSEGTDGGGDPGDSTDTLTLEDAKKVIKDLRGENSKYRTKNKVFEDRLGKIETGLKSIFGNGDDDDKLTPEQKVERLQAQNEGVAMQNAMLELCLEKGITDSDSRDFLAFLIEKEVDNLQDDEELSQEKIDELVQKAKSKGGGKKATSSPSGDGTGQEPNPEQSGEVTLGQFEVMNSIERGVLYGKNPALYNTLKAAALKKGTFV